MSAAMDCVVPANLLDFSKVTKTQEGSDLLEQQCRLFLPHSPACTSVPIQDFHLHFVHQLDCGDGDALAHYS